MKELFQFLKELRENNSRDWFKINKKRYDALFKTHVSVIQQLINRIAMFDPEIAALDAKSCIYRIYRDIRFSNDKTPYKTFIGAYMTGFGGRTSSYGGYYLHIDPDNPLVSGGVWQPEAKLLKLLRWDIYNNIEEFISIIENVKFNLTFGGLEGESLHRMPVGFPKDCPYESILRRKSFIVTSVIPEELFYSEDWMDKVIEIFKLVYPFNRFLNYTVGEFLGKK